MTTDTLRAAIIAALKRRGAIDDLDVTPSLTLLGSRTSTASVVLYGPDGVVIDVVARAGDDAKALRGVAFACGLREAPCPACDGRGRRAYGREVEDGCDECECAGVVVVDPEEERERLTRELAAARSTVDQLLGVVGAHGGEVARLQFALASEAARHAETIDVVREYFAAVSSAEPITPEFATRWAAAREAVRKIVEGDR